MTLVGFLLVTMERYEYSEASVAYGNRSTVYGFSGTDKVEALISCKPPDHASTLEMKMKIIHEAVLGISKPLDESGSV